MFARLNAGVMNYMNTLKECHEKYSSRSLGSC